MVRPLEVVQTLLLAAITVLLAIQVLAGSPAPRATLTQAPEFPTIPCQVADLFGNGEEHTCVPVRVLDAP